MKVLFPTLLLVTGVFHLFCCLLNKNKPRMISKPFLMPLLGVCWMLYAREPSFLVLAGILLGGIGDLALLWPLKRTPFFIGITAFLLGHVCYLIYIIRTYTFNAGLLWTIIIAAVYLSGSIGLYIKTRKEIPKLLRIPSVLYALALSALSACSLLVLISNPGTGKILAFTGASLFLMSDGILSQMLFVKKVETTGLNFIVMLTYIGAQVLLACGWAIR